MRSRTNRDQTDHRSATSKRPVRTLVEVSPYRTTGGASINDLTPYAAEHESYNERHAIATFALCHDVSAFASQSCEEQYVDQSGKLRHYIPDFEVTAWVPRLIVEVKALDSLVRDDAIDKYQVIARHYLKQNQPFAFLVDAQLEEAPRFASVKLLFRYVTSTLPEGVQRNAERALARGPLKISDLCNIANLQLVDVYTLIAKKHLCIDWSVPLSVDALASLPGQPFNGLHLEHILRSTGYGRLLADLAMGRRPTDQQLLASAPTWRRHRRPDGPYSCVGGFSRATPLRDLGEAESQPRKPWRRGDRAAYGAAFNHDTY